MLAAVLISLLLHVALSFAFINSKIGAVPDVAPTSIQVKFVPVNPLTVEEPQTAIEEALIEETVEEPTPALSEESIAEIETIEEPFEAEATFEVETEPARTSLVDIPEISIIDADPENEPDASESQDSASFLPSILTIRETVQSVDAADATRYWANDCNLLEEKSEIHNCQDTGPELSRFDVVDRNETYESLNPTKVFTRSERTVPTLTQNAPALAARLRSSDIPEGLSDYVLEELEIGITINSNTGNRNEQMRRRLTDRSAAAIQAERVLGDPWVKVQTRKLSDRNVHIQN